MNKKFLDYPFDQYSRQYLACQIVELCRPGKKKLKILDIGGHGGVTRDFFPKDYVTIADVLDVNYPGYIKADGRQLPFKDGEFDFVLSFDTLEHIPNNRQAFLAEATRVAKKMCVLAFPVKDNLVETAEKKLNNFYKEIKGQDHPWLKEHIQYGLPLSSQIDSWLGKNHFSYYQFNSNSLQVWATLQHLIFLQDEVKRIPLETGQLNRIYNERLSKLEPPLEPAYRKVYAISKDKQLIQKVAKKLDHAPDAQDYQKAKLEVIEAVFKAIKSLAGSFSKEILDLDRALTETNTNLLSTQTELKSLYASRLLRPFILIRRIGHAILVKFKIAGIYGLGMKILRNTPGLSRIAKPVDIMLRSHNIQRQRQAEYERWVTLNYPSANKLSRQREESKSFTSQPLISILVPTYNTNPKHLRECIESVINQSYTNWQLCIADDASTRKETRKIIEQFAGKDQRIKYTFRKQNGHICHASNSALKLAKGEYIALLDHDDILWPNALYEVVKTINEHPEADFIYSDEDKLEPDGRTHSGPFFKPDWSPDYLRAVNYITHFSVIRKYLVDKVGGFRPGYEGAQDWDLFLRVSRQTDQIFHIPTVIYSWRKSPTSTAQDHSAKDYAYLNQAKALEDDVAERGYQAELSWVVPYQIWRLKYQLVKEPLVSIIIPTKDSLGYIKRCLDSLFQKTTYPNYEVIVVDTGTTDTKVWRLYKKIQTKWPQLRVISWDKPFNFSSVCNYGAKEAKGEYLLFLNNDTEMITPDWIEGMLEHAQKPEVGAVGCKLLYPDDKIQHAGVILGIGGNEATPGVAGHLFQGYEDQPPADPYQNLYIGGVRNFSAVTAACVLIEARKFWQAKGFDTKFRIAFNDVDLCLKLIKKGWRTVFTPHVVLYHHESVSVGKPGSKGRDTNLLHREALKMGAKWGWSYLHHDPFYNFNFRLNSADSRVKIN